MTQIKGLIHSTESFGSVDGPGGTFYYICSGMSTEMSVLP